MTEEELQIQVAQWLNMWGVLWMHCPNEGKRSRRLGAKLKRMGLSPGVPDVLIFEAWQDGDFSGHGIAIELKTAKGRLTTQQEQWLDDLERRGWLTAVCRSLDEVMAECEALRPIHGRGMPR